MGCAAVHGWVCWIFELGMILGGYSACAGWCNVGIVEVSARWCSQDVNCVCMCRLLFIAAITQLHFPDDTERNLNLANKIDLSGPQTLKLPVPHCGIF